LKSELDLFSVPPTQTSIESGTIAEYNPISSIVHGLPIEFSVTGGGNDYIDIANTQLFVSAKITRANGDNIDDTDQVGPVNLAIHSLFSEVDLRLNDTLVSSTNNTYAYRAYLETLLSYGPDAKASQLTAAMYYKDTAGHMDVGNTSGANARNAGLVTRFGYFQGSRVIDMMDKLHLDLCFQERLIPSDVGIRLRLVRNKDAFCLMSAAAQPTYKIQIMDCKLYVRKVRLSPSVFVAHAKALDVGNAKYPINRVVCKTFNCPQGNLEFSQECLFSGQLPTRLLVSMVDTDSYNGTYAKNPYNFKHYEMTQLRLYLDGQPQTISPIEVDFANNQYIRGFLSIFSGTNKLGKDEGIDINRSEYAQGYTIVAWDLTPDMAERDHLNLNKEGTVRLDCKFRNALPVTINVIVYAEFESILELDRNKNVLCDYSS
jgi:hypothetical protein